MKLLHSLTLLLGSASLLPLQARAAIAQPSQLEANLGPLPIDKYDQINWDPTITRQYAIASNSGSCTPSGTVRQCLQAILQHFRQQGATGVRVKFALCGGAWSTALLNCGTGYNSGSLNSAWVSKMNLFLDDVAASGFTNITVSPVPWSYYNVFDPYCYDGTYTCGENNGQFPLLTQAREPGLNDGLRWTNTEWDSCTGSYKPLFFWPAAPFGVRGHNTQNDPTGPWKAQYDQSYNCSPHNPYFVGWQNIYNVIDAVLAGAHCKFRRLT